VSGWRKEPGRGHSRSRAMPCIKKFPSFQPFRGQRTPRPSDSSPGSFQHCCSSSSLAAHRPFSSARRASVLRGGRAARRRMRARRPDLPARHRTAPPRRSTAPWTVARRGRRWMPAGRTWRVQRAMPATPEGVDGMPRHARPMMPRIALESAASSRIDAAPSSAAAGARPNRCVARAGRTFAGLACVRRAARARPAEPAMGARRCVSRARARPESNAWPAAAPAIQRPAPAAAPGRPVSRVRATTRVARLEAPARPVPPAPLAKRGVACASPTARARRAERVTVARVRVTRAPAARGCTVLRERAFATPRHAATAAASREAA
jgi:hypothetical protein